nr:ABC transporter ATP-binding protein [Hydrogeniiclostridium mannosilyticum]
MFFINAFFMLLTLAIGMITPLLYQILIDRVILNGEINQLYIVVIGYLSFFAFSAGIGYIQNYINNRITNSMTFRIKYKIWRNLFKYSAKDYNRVDKGDIKMKMENDIGSINAFISSQTISYGLSLLTLLFAGIIMIYFEWRIALFAFLVIPVTYLIDNIIGKKEKKYNESNRVNDSNMNSWLHEVFCNWKEVRVLNAQKYNERNFLHYLHNYARYYVKYINIWVLRGLVIPKIKNEFLMQFAVYFLGGIFIMQGNITIGTLLVFIQYYNKLNESIQQVSSLDSSLLGQMPFIDRVYNEMKSEKKSPKNKKLNKNHSQFIVFNNVTFSYEDSPNTVLNDLSFRIDDGDIAVITGKSGYGKTTILKLLLGIEDVCSGDIKFSGTNINELDDDELYKQVSYVMQKNILYNESIYDNLLYGNPNADVAQIKDACKMAHIYDFIMDLPQEFDTIIGENGIKLSGGQRQRLLLARVFLKDAKILILDEATSAVDYQTEAAIYDDIISARKYQIIIIVTHRKSMLRYATKHIEIKTS